MESLDSLLSGIPRFSFRGISRILFSCSFFPTSLTYSFANVLEELVFVLVLILTLVSIVLGFRIGLGSKIPFYLLSYLSIRHSRNYGVKTRKFPGRGKDPLPVSSTKRYIKPRSVHLPYGTICIFIHHRRKRKLVSVSLSRDDGNGKSFGFHESSNHDLNINPNSECPGCWR